jgi:hypothetical protein
MQAQKETEKCTTAMLSAYVILKSRFQVKTNPSACFIRCITLSTTGKTEAKDKLKTLFYSLKEKTLLPVLPRNCIYHFTCLFAWLTSCNQDVNMLGASESVSDLSHTFHNLYIAFLVCFIDHVHTAPNGVPHKTIKNTACNFHCPQHVWSI